MLLWSISSPEPKCNLIYYHTRLKKSENIHVSLIETAECFKALLTFKIDIFRCDALKHRKICLANILKLAPGWSHTRHQAVALPSFDAGCKNGSYVKIFILFQTIPILIPKSLFKEFNKHTSSYILILPLPNSIDYYWTAGVHELVLLIQLVVGEELRPRAYNTTPGIRLSDLCPAANKQVSFYEQSCSGVSQWIHTAAPPSSDHMRLQWEEELDSQILELSWQLAVGLAYCSSIGIMDSLLQCRVLHRLHLTSSKLELYSVVVEDGGVTWTPTAICLDGLMPFQMIVAELLIPALLRPHSGWSQRIYVHSNSLFCKLLLDREFLFNWFSSNQNKPSDTSLLLTPVQACARVWDRCQLVLRFLCGFIIWKFIWIYVFKTCLSHVSLSHVSTAALLL